MRTDDGSINWAQWIQNEREALCRPHEWSGKQIKEFRGGLLPPWNQRVRVELDRCLKCGRERWYSIIT